MNDLIFENNMYSVIFAEQREIGEEWNHVQWNKHHRQIQYHRLYLLTEGEAKLKLYDRELHLSPGWVYFIPAFSVLESNIDDRMNKYYIHFQSQARFFSLYKYISNRYAIEAGALTESLFKTVVENYTDPSLAARLRVQGALNLIISDFVNDVKADAPGLGKFESVLKYIDEHYKQNIKLDELASIMNISRMYFSNLFKCTFRISPKQYILNKRLTESQRLLLETRLSIKEIAYSVGFENENYFSEFFASKVGISALKFRNRDLPRTRDSIL